MRQWNLFKEVRDALVVQLACPLPISMVLTHRKELRGALRECRPKRPRQMEKLKRVLRR